MPDMLCQNSKVLGLNLNLSESMKKPAGSEITNFLPRGALSTSSSVAANDVSPPLAVLPLRWPGCLHLSVG